ncbi:hypothetical protein NDU88_001247 [Pleurodeles waltl]|uniref:Uncharacterized protein n=1 Tax=Pleurodeles waltl TaxID=8319 RepID=A0AAV7MKD9_PLEWA|nr:hypothetical protein NDU88_001247 [Pleurodeles waltl]
MAAAASEICCFDPTVGSTVMLSGPLPNIGEQSKCTTCCPKGGPTPIQRSPRPRAALRFLSRHPAAWLHGLLS